MRHRLGHGPAPMRPPRLTRGMHVRYWRLTMLDLEGFAVETTEHDSREGCETRRDAQMRTGRFGGYIVVPVWSQPRTTSEGK